MRQKLVRSGVQHSVTFNEVTRNAVSPKHELKKVDRKSESPENSDDELTIDTQYSDEHFAQAKPHIQDRIQGVSEVITADNRLLISEQTIQSNIQTVSSSNHYKNNIQHVGSNNHYQDNIQRFSNPSELTDNWQTFDNTPVNHSELKLSELTEISTPSSSPRRKTPTKSALKVKPAPPMTDKTEANDNELQAQIQRMKKKLANANKKLKDIQDRT